MSLRYFKLKRLKTILDALESFNTLVIFKITALFLFRNEFNTNFGQNSNYRSFQINGKHNGRILNTATVDKSLQGGSKQTYFAYLFCNLQL